MPMAPLNSLQQHFFALAFLAAFSLIHLGCAQESDAPPTMSAIQEIAALEAAEREKSKMPPSHKAKLLEPIGEIPNKENADTPKADLPADVPPSGTYEVEFDTDVGKFIVTVKREWAPRGAHRFYRLVQDGYYDGAGFFRVIKGFMVQWGLAADPAATAKWDVNIQDDPVVQSNQRGYITFAKTGAPNSRSTQVFINYGDNARLDSQGFAPFGIVRSGMENVEKISDAHGEQPSQGDIRQYGNSYLKSRFEEITYIKTAKLLIDDLGPPPGDMPEPGEEDEFEAKKAAEAAAAERKDAADESPSADTPEEGKPGEKEAGTKDAEAGEQPAAKD